MNQTIKQQASFKQTVLKIVKDIPKGKTLTYKEVAYKAGSPNAARVVGTIMSHNADISIPCHRVIRSDGTVGGYNGIRGGRVGATAKQEILKAEKAI